MYITLGLAAIALAVLILPLKVKQIERNMEVFFLIMGILAVTVSGLWSRNLAVSALSAAVMIGKLPVGITQVVLGVGLLIHYYNKRFCDGILYLANRLGPMLSIFLLILVAGIFSSVVSVILTAVVLAEVVAALPLSKNDKTKVMVTACFALGLGAVLTPLAEPLSTIMVDKLAGAPYHAGFFFPLRTFGIYIIPGIIAISAFGAIFIGRKRSWQNTGVAADASETYTESIRDVIMRAVKVYVFVAALTLLGEGLKPLVLWYFTSIPAWIFYWLNIDSAFLDNGTLTAIEIGPSMALPQIISAIMGLLIAGGMLIPGNIPNIVAAVRLRINMMEWAKIGVPRSYSNLP